jgi:hypothetical protein
MQWMQVKGKGGRNHSLSLLIHFWSSSFHELDPHISLLLQRLEMFLFLFLLCLNANYICIMTLPPAGQEFGIYYLHPYPYCSTDRLVRLGEGDAGERKEPLSLHREWDTHKALKEEFVSALQSSLSACCVLLNSSRCRCWYADAVMHERSQSKAHRNSPSPSECGTMQSDVYSPLWELWLSCGWLFFPACVTNVW